MALANTDKVTSLDLLTVIDDDNESTCAVIVVVVNILFIRILPFRMIKSL